MEKATEGLFLGKADEAVFLNPKYANRHGLIAGATGTGKTVTLQIMAEQFSRMGVPVFMADVKGDLSGMSVAGTTHEKLEERAQTIGLDDYAYRAFPVIFWDLFGENGHPMRTTISEMGPLLLTRLMDLTEAQEGVLNIAFRIADEQGLLLLDLEDLRAMLVWLDENADEVRAEYGLVSKASIGAIQRGLLILEQQGAEHFFGEPALELADLMRTTTNGEGVISILDSRRLMNESPQLYATFLLWLLSELFEDLPEVGDPDKPKLVFFFDEAHLLFSDAPKSLVQKIEQVVRLIRSKGVGVYFVTQNPLDVPETVLGQLGNRVQHALRAFTPRDQKAVQTAADTFRPNPEFEAREVITELGVGEALVSTLLKKGIPGVVQRTLIRPPSSRLGPATDAERKAVLKESPVAAKYDKEVDRESAHEMLTKRAEAAEAQEETAEQAEDARTYGYEGGATRKRPQRSTRKPSAKPRPKAKTRTRKKSSRRSDSFLQTAGKQAVKFATSRHGSKMLRGVLGSLFKGR